MNIVIFGLSISSAWGNGHATLLRGLFRALQEQGHSIDFFERDTPYYAAHRDVTSLPYARLHLYSDWNRNLAAAKAALECADIGMVTSYCPDGIAAAALVLDAKLPRTIFYDMDAPVTLSRLARGEAVPYIPPEGLGDFDLVLSYTGGRALDELRTKLNARRAATLYGWVDPAVHHRVDCCAKFAADLSYLGTYSADRQSALDNLLIEPARLLQSRTFIIAGAMYPNPQSWPENCRHLEHVAPPDHATFYSSSPLTLSVTRGDMAAMGYCPSGRLFEAAACGTAVLSDFWEGLDTFFEPGSQILIASNSSEAIAAITKDRASLDEIGARARERVLDCHTAEIRARRFIELAQNPSDEYHELRELCVSDGH
ncbi:MAG TPA: glycosyltransferase [Bryobacteraceae bacterium]|jgi:spore maturation protein CgeB|nr:glycosyltransferase [Bryobacteraceae bacterium]